MLGKLMKYDMKIQMKSLGIMYLVVCLLAGTSAIFEMIDRRVSERTGIIIHIMNQVTRGLAVLAVIVMVAGTFIYVILHFRKNLLKDEGYLMFTLPVKAWQLYFSKWITASCCCLVSILVAGLALMLTFLHIPDISDFLLGMSAAGISKGCVVLMVIVLIISVPANLPQFYVSLAFGYTIQPNTKSPVNKDLLSVISYIVLYMIQQALGVLLLIGWIFITIIGTGDDGIALFDSVEITTAQMNSMMYGIYIMAIIVSVVTSIILSGLSIWRMNKHLNMN